MNRDGEPPLLRTGVPGLDDVLFGGLLHPGLHLVAGEPGTGKTTLGLQFLPEGRRRGERALFITISQDRRGLGRIAAGLGLSLDGVMVEEISALHFARADEERRSAIDTSTVELSTLMAALHDAMRRSGAERVVVASLFELRLLSRDTPRHRRELLLLRDIVRELDATALFLDNGDDELGDRQLEGLSNGVLSLGKHTPSFGPELRHVRVDKMRGHDFVGGHQDLTIRRGGVAVFPAWRPSSPPSG